MAAASQSSSGARVKYKIVKCTSEDPEYPVSELLAHSSQTKGWQTARYCEFPQEIGLQFESPVHLRQVQFLSHQSKIATKIELFTAMPQDGSRYESAQFKRLGYLSLDSNERSQFQARELKSVYVDVSAQYLRIVLHKCHTNRYNIVNQVGLIALHCSGELLAGHDAVGAPPAPIINLARKSLPNKTQEPADRHVPAAEPAPAPAQRSAAPPVVDRVPSQVQRPSGTPTSRGAEPMVDRIDLFQRGPAEPAVDVAPRPVAEPPVVSTPQSKPAASEFRPQPRQQQVPEPAIPPPPAPVVPAAAAAPAPAPQRTNSEEQKFDARTMERIRDLTAAKQKAVENEDYEEAKRCKQMMERLRETGEQLKDLEERKRLAVEGEDYDVATSLKAEIERLRASAEIPLNKAESRERVNARLPVPEKSSHGHDRQNSEDRRPSDWAPPPQQMTAPRGGHQPVMAQNGYDSRYDSRYDTSGGGASGSQRAASHGRLSAASPDASPHGASGDASFANDFGSYGRGGPSPKFNPVYDEPPSLAPGPPMPFDDAGGDGGGIGEHIRASGGMNARGPSSAEDLGGGFNGAASNGFSSGGGGSAPSSEAAYYLQGVPNVEDLLASPEPLTAALSQDKECMQLVQAFGDYISRCLHSKTWNLRDAAIQKLAIDLRDGSRDADDPNQLLLRYAIVLKRTIADKNVQVSLSSGGLLQAVAQVLLQSGRIRRADAQASLEGIMPLLVDRLGEVNARVDKTARDALLDFARCQHIGAPFTAQYLLKTPKKKNGAPVHARVFSSRLQVLTALASDFGVQPESRDGVPLEQAVKLAMDCFTHKEGDVRENSVKLVAACHMHVGLRRIEGYLSNLRPAQREVFDAEFDRVSGASGQQGRPPQAARFAPRMDDGYSNSSGGLPAPAVAPPRGSGGGSRSLACMNAYPQEEEQYVANNDDQEVEEFTCPFCMRQDPSFTPDRLDMHYWKECPMLIQCKFCEQVIEICQLRSHLLEECEVGAPAQAAGHEMHPQECPLCRTNLGSCEERDWREHILFAGCPGNARSSRNGGSYGHR